MGIEPKHKIYTDSNLFSVLDSKFTRNYKTIHQYFGIMHNAILTRMILEWFLDQIAAPGPKLKILDRFEPFFPQWISLLYRRVQKIDEIQPDHCDIYQKNHNKKCN